MGEHKYRQGKQGVVGAYRNYIALYLGHKKY